MRRIDYKHLVDFHNKILNKAGLDDFSRESVTTGLCETSLRGVDTHGVRLLPHYTRSALMGRKNPRPNLQFISRYPSMGCLEADNAFGHAAGMKAIDHCMEMADQVGVGVVGVANSSHPGAMASFALRAARKGYMAMAFTHADALLLSHNGKRTYFGTNPVCLAVPRLEETPYCLDMATSQIPWNRVLLSKSTGARLPEGSVGDADGQLTTDSDKATCLMPTGSYKGYGLASMVEVMCGIFTGMKFGRDLPAMFTTPMDKPRHLGQFYMVMKVDGCISEQLFRERMQTMTEEVRKEPAIEGEQVMLPGDPEIHAAKERLVNGIPLDPLTVEGFKQLAEQFDFSLQFLD